MHKHEKKGCVEELHYECNDSCLSQPTCLSLEANPINKHDTDSSEDVVDAHSDIG